LKIGETCFLEGADLKRNRPFNVELLRTKRYANHRLSSPAKMRRRADP
jgi:hypothetical protein